MKIKSKLNKRDNKKKKKSKNADLLNFRDHKQLKKKMIKMIIKRNFIKLPSLIKCLHKMKLLYLKRMRLLIKVKNNYLFKILSLNNNKNSRLNKTLLLFRIR